MPRIIAQESNKKLKGEYRLRFATVLFSMLTVAVVITGVLLIPTYVLLDIYHKAYTRPELDGSSEVEQLNVEYMSKLNETHQLSERVMQGDSVYLDVMDTLFSYAQGGVSIDAIDLSRSEESVAITLRGMSATRDDLLTLERSVLANKKFKGFALPLETLTKQSDIQFNVTFTYNEK